MELILAMRWAARRDDSEDEEAEAEEAGDGEAEASRPAEYLVKWEGCVRGWGRMLLTWHCVWCVLALTWHDMCC